MIYHVISKPFQPRGMHNDNSSCNHGCVLDRVVTGQVDGSFRGTADGVLNLSIYNDNETYGSGSEPVVIYHVIPKSFQPPQLYAYLQFFTVNT